MAVESVNSSTSNVAGFVRPNAEGRQAQESQQAQQAQRAERREAPPEERAERKEETKKPPVVNALGQTTGTLINVTA